jgi:hypothetical protein
MLRNLRGLFVGGRPCWSLGRVAFWLVFGLAYWRWAAGQDITQSHEYILAVIILYIFGGKISSQITGRKISVQGEKE